MKKLLDNIKLLTVRQLRLIHCNIKIILSLQYFKRVNVKACMFLRNLLKNILLVINKNYLEGVHFKIL